MAEAENDDQAREKVRGMIEQIEVALMVTIAADGGLHARPMRAMAMDGDGHTLWFFSRVDSVKAAELREDQRVLLAYSDPRGQNYVAVDGSARVVRDPAKQQQLWREPARVWFPQGAESPELALIAVRMEGAAYWDSPSSTLVHAFGDAKALATGAPPHPGDEGKVRF